MRYLCTAPLFFLAEGFDEQVSVENRREVVSLLRQVLVGGVRKAPRIVRLIRRLPITHLLQNGREYSHHEFSLPMRIGLHEDAFEVRPGSMRADE